MMTLKIKYLKCFLPVFFLKIGIFFKIYCKTTFWHTSCDLECLKSVLLVLLTAIYTKLSKRNSWSYLWRHLQLACQTEIKIPSLQSETSFFHSGKIMAPFYIISTICLWSLLSSWFTYNVITVMNPGLLKDEFINIWELGIKLMFTVSRLRLKKSTKPQLPTSPKKPRQVF